MQRSAGQSTLETYQLYRPFRALLTHNRFVALGPQRLNFPPLSLPQPIVPFDQINMVQVRDRVQSIFDFKSILRSDMVRHRVSGQRGRVRAVLHVNTDVAHDVRSDHQKNFFDEVANGFPAFHSVVANNKGHVFAL
jgi:hypothetical protein